MKRITISRTTNTIRVDGHETEFFMLESKYIDEKIVFIKSFNINPSDHIPYMEERKILDTIEKQLKDDFDKMYSKDWIYKEIWSPNYYTYIIKYTTRKW